MLYAMHPLLNSNIRFGSSHWAPPLPTSWLFCLQGWNRRRNEPHEWAKGQCKAKTRVRQLEAPKGQNVSGCWLPWTCTPLPGASYIRSAVAQASLSLAPYWEGQENTAAASKPTSRKTIRNSRRAEGSFGTKTPGQHRCMGQNQGELRKFRIRIGLPKYIKYQNNVRVQANIYCVPDALNAWAFNLHNNYHHRRHHHHHHLRGKKTETQWDLVNCSRTESY